MNDRRAAIRQNFEAAAAQVRALLGRVTADSLDKVSVGDANPGWDVRKVVAHLAASPDTLVMVGERMRKGQRIDFPAPVIGLMGWWSRFQRRGHSPEQALAEFDAGCQHAVAFVESCSDEDLDRKAKLPVLGEQALETWVNVYGFHMASHIASIQPVLPAAPAPAAS